MQTLPSIHSKTVLWTLASITLSLLVINQISQKMTQNAQTLEPQSKIKPVYPTLQEHIQRRSAILGNVEYRIKMTFKSKKTSYFVGTQILFFTNTLKDTFLDFQKKGLLSMLVNGISVQVDPQTNQNNRIIIPGNLLKLGLNKIDVSAEIQFNKYPDGLIRRDKVNDEWISVFGSFYNASNVFPSFDQNDINGLFTLTVTCPQTWKVVTNQKESTLKSEITANSDFKSSPISLKKVAIQDLEFDIRIQDDDMKTVNFTQTPPIPPYLLTLCLGNYETRPSGSTKLDSTFYYLRDDTSALDKIMPALVQIQEFAVQYMTEFTGTPLPFQKIDNAFMAVKEEAEEFPGCIVYNRQLLQDSETSPMRRAYLESIVMHETSHFWFGDYITARRWSDAFFHEAFANFLEYKIYEKYQEANPPDLKVTSRWDLYKKYEGFGIFDYDVLVRSQEQAAWSQGVYYEWQLAEQDFPDLRFNPSLYRRGQSTLSQIERYVGKKFFKETIQKIFAERHYGDITYQEFVSAFGADFEKRIQDLMTQSSFDVLHIDQKFVSNLTDSETQSWDPEWLIQSFKARQFLKIHIADTATDSTFDAEVQIDNQIITKESSSDNSHSSLSDFDVIIPNPSGEALFLVQLSADLLKPMTFEVLSKLDPTLFYTHLLNMKGLVVNVRENRDANLRHLAPLLNEIIKQTDHILYEFALKILEPLVIMFGETLSQDFWILDTLVDLNSPLIFTLFGRQINTLSDKFDINRFFAQKLSNQQISDSVQSLSRLNYINTLQASQLLQGLIPPSLNTYNISYPRASNILFPKLADDHWLDLVIDPNVTDDMLYDVYHLFLNCQQQELPVLLSQATEALRCNKREDLFLPDSFVSFRFDFIMDVAYKNSYKTTGQWLVDYGRLNPDFGPDTVLFKLFAKQSQMFLARI